MWNDLTLTITQQDLDAALKSFRSHDGTYCHCLVEQALMRTLHAKDAWAGFTNIRIEHFEDMQYQMHESVIPYIMEFDNLIAHRTTSFDLPLPFDVALTVHSPS